MWELVSRREVSFFFSLFFPLLGAIIVDKEGQISDNMSREGEMTWNITTVRYFYK